VLLGVLPVVAAATLTEATPFLMLSREEVLNMVSFLPQELSSCFVPLSASPAGADAGADSTAAAVGAGVDAGAEATAGVGACEMGTGDALRAGAGADPAAGAAEDPAMPK
jgi:hypothetical protein